MYVVSVVSIMELFKTFFLSFLLHRAEVTARRRAKVQAGDPYLRVCGLVPPHRSQPPPPPSGVGQRHRMAGTKRSGDIGDSLNVFDGGGRRQFPSGEEEDIVFRRPQLPKRRPDAVSPPDRTPPPPGEVTKFPVASAVHGKERGERECGGGGEEAGCVKGKVSLRPSGKMWYNLLLHQRPFWLGPWKSWSVFVYLVPHFKFF